MSKWSGIELVDQNVYRNGNPRPDKTMYRQLTEHAEKSLRSLGNRQGGEDALVGQLRRVLADLMACGEANADTVCRRLRVSRRTMQRRLQAEKTSFQKVLNEVRADLAVRYLSDKRLKSFEVAMLLGYSNLSSFTTAFKSWYDMPPAAYRQKILGAGS
jgi:AraC-like DNA-binding protein